MTNTVKLVILLGDGDPTRGVKTLEGLVARASLMHNDGIRITTVGLAQESPTHIALMQGIADAAGGEYHHTDDLIKSQTFSMSHLSQLKLRAIHTAIAGLMCLGTL